VFFAREMSRRLLDTSLGFTAGVITAASFWSLLAPSIALAEEMGYWPWLPALVGFLLGGAAIWCGDRLLPRKIDMNPIANLRDARGAPQFGDSHLTRVKGGDASRNDQDSRGV
jgi:ZIP family zinc transporter